MIDDFTPAECRENAADHMRCVVGAWGTLLAFLAHGMTGLREVLRNNTAHRYDAAAWEWRAQRVEARGARP